MDPGSLPGIHPQDQIDCEGSVEVGNQTEVQPALTEIFSDSQMLSDAEQQLKTLLRNEYFS
jgi:hypothetical protein